MPFTAAIFVVAGLASLGLPGLSGFVSEVLVFIGTFSVWELPTAAAVVGIILAAGYILWMIQRVLAGPSLERYAQVKEATKVEAVPMVVLVVAIVVVGLYPGVLIDSFDAAIAPIIEMRFP